MTLRTKDEQESHDAAARLALAREQRLVALRELARLVYADRKARRSHPEGKFDGHGRWIPSVREDADGDGSSTRAPSRAWPYSYLLRCRTLAHACVLAERFLSGDDVPPDVFRFGWALESSRVIRAAEVASD